MTKSEKEMHSTFSIVQTEVEKWRRGKKITSWAVRYTDL